MTLYRRLLCLSLLAAGCEHPPLVDKTWANKARMVVSPDTPLEDTLPLPASYGPDGAREETGLTRLDGDQGLGRVEITLDAGCYVLDEPVTLSGAEVVIEGKGPHKTQILLDSSNKTSLLIERAPRITIKGVTMIGTSGGGIRVRDCQDVRVEDVCFAGARFGLDLANSSASVSSSTFAGCQEAIVIDQGQLTLRECAFTECWVGVAGQGKLDAESCAFVDGREGLKLRLQSSSRVVGCLFAGQRQAAGWEGRPGEARANLAGLVDLGDRLGPETNRLIHRSEEFPDDLPQGLPPAFDLAAVHLCLERARVRGEKDPPGRLRAAAEDMAVTHARLARVALLAQRVEEARREARLAFRYVGSRPLADLPREVAAITDLAAE